MVSLNVKCIIAKRVLNSIFHLDSNWSNLYANYSPNKKFWRIMDGCNEFASRIIVESLDECGKSQLDRISNSFNKNNKNNKNYIHTCSSCIKPLSNMHMHDLNKLIDELLLKGRTWAQVKSMSFSPKNSMTEKYVRCLCSSSLDDACSHSGFSIEEAYIEDDLQQTEIALSSIC